MDKQVNIKRSEYYKGRMDLYLVVQTYKRQLNAYQNELSYIISTQGPGDVKAIDYTKIGDSKTPDSLANVYERIHELTLLIAETSRKLRCYEEELNSLDEEIERVASELGDMELKVFRYRFILRFKVYDVAKTVGYSKDRINQIIRGIKNRMNGTV